MYARTTGCQLILTLLENIKSFEACSLESIKHSFSVLKCQAISNSIFCFLNSFLEPASIPCKFFPWSFAILVTTYIILSNFFKEGYLFLLTRVCLPPERTSRCTESGHSLSWLPNSCTLQESKV